MTGAQLKADPPLLDVSDLYMSFPLQGKGMFSRKVEILPVLKNVSLSIREGEVLGLVGESGSGKSTLGRCLIGIYRPDRGAIRYTSKSGETADLARLKESELRPYQREIRMIFQDPFSSLNPRMNITQIVGDPLLVNKIASGSELEDRVAAMLKRVGISPDKRQRYPHAFSGGERQRISIARALIMEPRLVIADEAVSALDVSIRAQVLDLLKGLQEDFNLTYLFISHDLSVVEDICDRVAVMLQGEIVEMEDTETLYGAPKHDYTKSLLRAVPIPDPRLRVIREEPAPGAS